MALASSFIGGNTKPMYVSGGNDNTIALWDVSGSSNHPHRPNNTADGKYAAASLTSSSLANKTCRTSA